MTFPDSCVCLKLTAAFGLPSAKVAIADFKGARVLVVERFDRLWTRDKRLLRLPQEDCCQALSVPPTRKYEFDGGPGMAAILDLSRRRSCFGFSAPRTGMPRISVSFCIRAAASGSPRSTT